MKSIVLLICSLFAAGLAMAQSAPAPAQAPRATAGTAASTNEIKIRIELREIQSKLGPIQDTIIKTDPDIKANQQQCQEAEQLRGNLDKKRRELIEAKLQADPTAAPLLKRRTELVVKIQEMRNAGEPIPGPDLEMASRLGMPPAPRPAPKAP